MKDSTLLSIALSCSLIGIFLLLIISEKVNLDSSNISGITEKLNNKYVKIKGTITNSRETPGLLILDVKDNTGSIKVIAFKESQINLTKNQIIEVEGKITKYQDSLEIIADKITLF